MKISLLKINKSNIIKKYKLQILLTILLVFFSLCFILNSSKYIGVVLEGIILYGVKVLPGLLPFFFITKIFGSFDFIISFCNKFKRLSKLLYNTPSISCYIFFMSIISGYPMGAKLTTEFYEMGLINKPDAQKIMSFCSTSGPMFVIGTVGVGFFANEFLGIMLFLVHVISSIINGLLYRNIKTKKEENFNYETNIKLNNNFSLEDAMYSTIKSLLIVGGYIVIFYTLIEVLLDFKILSPLISLFSIFGLNNYEATGLVSGIIEITKGISILCKTSNIKLAFMLSSSLISFSGISIFVQSLSFLNKLKISKKLFLLQKITHSIISLAISYLFSLLIL